MAGYEGPYEGGWSAEEKQVSQSFLSNRFRKQPQSEKN